jgi:hypothetical protein
MARESTCRPHGNFGLGWAAALVLLASPVHGDGFDEHYVAYYGDANGDRRTDIYLQWEPERDVVQPEDSDDSSIPVPSSPPDVPNTLLTQTASGTFAINTGAVAQSRFAHWQKLPSPAVVAVVDFNMDGYMDIGLRFLGHLSAIFPESVGDQIVYASEVKGAAPSVVKVIDAAALKFFKELHGWLTNAEYFAQNAPRNPSATGSITLDYSVFDPRALSAATLLEKVVTGNEQITRGGEIESGLKKILGDVLGVGVYGGVFNEGSLDYEDHAGFVMDQYGALIMLAVQLSGRPSE